MLNMDFNVKDNFGDTPLLRAVKSNSIEYFKLLRQKNADLTMENRNSALCFANKYHFKEMGKQLEALQ